MRDIPPLPISKPLSKIFAEKFRKKKNFKNEIEFNFFCKFSKFYRKCFQRFGIPSNAVESGSNVALTTLRQLLYLRRIKAISFVNSLKAGFNKF